MICRLLATAAFLFASGKCQSEIATLTSPSAGPSSTVASTRSAVSTHTIDVSYNQSHKFEPDSLKADLGDVIEFHFFPNGHSVVRAQQENPCEPIELHNKSADRFFSDFQHTDLKEFDSHDSPVFRLEVNDTEPIWFYCSAPNSCNVYEMIGVVNPVTEDDLRKEKDVVSRDTCVLQPGDQRRQPGEPCPSSSPTSTQATNNSSPTLGTLVPSMNAPPSRESFPVAAIAGIVVGAVLIFSLGAGLFFLLGRQKSSRRSASPPLGSDEAKRRSGAPSFYSPTSPGRTSYSTSMRRASAIHPSPVPMYVPVMGSDGIVYQQPFVNGLGPVGGEGTMHQTWPLYSAPMQHEPKGSPTRLSPADGNVASALPAAPPPVELEVSNRNE